MNDPKCCEGREMPEKSYRKSSVGILAYGSLVSDPGQEIERARTHVIEGVRTPFNVEFARSSTGRGGAPTLVPVKSGGAQVSGQVFVINLPETEAKNILYRREINKVGTDRIYKPPGKEVVIERLTNFADIGVVLYVKNISNIEPLTAKKLADLAIKSVKMKSCRDGIKYLIDVKKNRIVTALSQEYEAEILREKKCSTLEEARTKILAEL